MGNSAREFWRKEKVDFLINIFRERILEFHYVAYLDYAKELHKKAK